MVISWSGCCRFVKKIVLSNSMVIFKKENRMIELIIGIIIGATFAEFWRHVYRVVRKKTSAWMSDSKSED